eukprot:7827543-Alexandrium_andersonii.AAC.1
MPSTRHGTRGKVRVLATSSTLRGWPSFARMKSAGRAPETHPKGLRRAWEEPSNALLRRLSRRPSDALGK